jgi:hypothetical protein
MIQILEKKSLLEKRRITCWKKARRRTKYASTYLALLTAKSCWMDEQERQYVVDDIESILTEALQYVRWCRRLEYYQVQLR